MKQTSLCLFVTASLMFVSANSLRPLSAAEKLAELDSWTAKEYAQYLVEMLAEVKGQQIKVDADAEEAFGLAAGSEGIILVPIAGLKEEEEDADVHTEKGSGLACLFLSPRFNPIVDGKQIPQEKLLTIKYSDDSGVEQLATCLLLAARNVAGDDWRLYAYGKDAKPVVDAPFKMVEHQTDKPIAIAVKEAGENDATLEFTLFGKYGANFKIGR